MALARERKIDAVLVTELTRWGRSTLDLVQTMNDLQSCGVSLVAITGLTFDLSSATGKLLATLLAGIAEFERDMLVERVRSGLAAAQRRGVKLGRQVGQNPSDKHAARVLNLIAAGHTYRDVAHRLQISPTTVTAIVKRNRS